MVLYTLHEHIKLDRWDEFKAVIAEVKDIANTVRAEDKRVKKSLTTLIVVRPIKDIIAPLSLIFNYRYKDDKLRQLLTAAVQGLHRLALEIESLYETRFVTEFRRLATTLVSFLSQGEGVQLTLFNAEKYHDPQAAKKKLPGFWRWWNYRVINRLGFSNPYKNTTTDYTQLSIKGLWQKQENRRMNFIRTAFFDEPEVVDSPQKLENSTIALADLGLR